jgi:hypothetical protein
VRWSAIVPTTAERFISLGGKVRVIKKPITLIAALMGCFLRFDISNISDIERRCQHSFMKLFTMFYEERDLSRSLSS